MIVLGIFIGIIVISFVKAFIDFVMEVKRMIENDEENKEEY
jgi:predicted PurR-regulated permease PerM